MTKRVLIIGGTGVFGKRLARHLLGFAKVELFISSRSVAKAESFAELLRRETPTACVKGVALDHGTNLAKQLAAIKPFAVIDCSGPFQTANYDTARAVIRSGAHLIDLADARDYLAGFAQELDAEARKHGVTALTGASSTPTLSTCIVAHVTQGWQRVDAIDICITPGGKSEVGRSVIEAILSYAGKEVATWQGGKLAKVTGWRNASKVTLPHLGQRRVAAVETYDAEYLGPRFNVTSHVTFSAGLESRIEQHGIEMIAFLRKHHLFLDPKALIPLLLAARRITRIPTSDQGGMMVQASGLNAQGQCTTAKWSLLAKNDHGPNIPILPAAAALLCLLENDVPTGATFAHTHITLAQILTQMAPYEIEITTSP